MLPTKSAEFQDINYKIGLILLCKQHDNVIKNKQIQQSDPR